MLQRVRAALTEGRPRWEETLEGTDRSPGREAPWSVRASAVVWALLTPVLEPVLVGLGGGIAGIAALREMADGSRGGPLSLVFVAAFLASLSSNRVGAVALRLLACEPASWRQARLRSVIGMVRHAVPLATHLGLAGLTASTAIAASVYGPLLAASVLLAFAAARGREAQGEFSFPQPTVSHPRAASPPATPMESRVSGVIVVVLANALVAFNLMSFELDGSYYPKLFPLAFAVMAAGGVQIITGRRPDRFADGPIRYWVVTLIAMGAGLAVGVLLNHAVFGAP